MRVLPAFGTASLSPAPGLTNSPLAALREHLWPRYANTSGRVTRTPLAALREHLRPRYANASGGGAGDDSACASVIGLAAATNRSSAAPSTSRAGNGSAAARLISPPTGSSRWAAATT